MVRILDVSGLLLLNGGNEFGPGNEPQDRLLVAKAGPGPACVVPTAAARQSPERAVATAQSWFAGLGLEVTSLPVLTRRDAESEELAGRASEAGSFYLVGGDPGLVVKVLRESRVWRAMVDAWRRGAVLAGSSAGAMALCEWTLVNAGWPRHDRRRPLPALGLVPGVAVLPHHNAFGRRWQVADAPDGMIPLGIDERTAAVWDGAWRAEGAGAVIVGDRRFTAGQAIEGLPEPEA
jgi:cyanophycinase